MRSKVSHINYVIVSLCFPHSIPTFLKGLKVILIESYLATNDTTLENVLVEKLPFNRKKFL